jgi:NAD(P)-dependent dehydrogenase (short-subunit alcohol dehydrogenase family)
VDVVRRTVEALGRLDVLVNAAGTDAPGTVEELDLEGWDRTLAVNLRAPFLLSEAVFPHMREAGRGTIINISSVAGKKGWANASYGPGAGDEVVLPLRVGWQTSPNPLTKRRPPFFTQRHRVAWRRCLAA